MTTNCLYFSFENMRKISYSANKSRVFDLQMAIKMKNLERVQSIMKSGPQLNLNSIRFIDKSTPLSYAIYIGFEGCVQLLLDYGSDANRNSTDNIGRIEPPLCTAIRIGDTKTLKILLNINNIDVNRSDFFSQRPVYLCVRYRRPEYLRLIIGHKDFDLKTSRNLSIKTNPLYLSAKYINMGRLECFQILINSGFKVNQKIIDYVIQNRNQRALTMIEMSTGKALTIDGQKVFTLKQLTRITIREILVGNSGRPLISDILEKILFVLPHSLIQFLMDLSQKL